MDVVEDPLVKVYCDNCSGTGIVVGPAMRALMPACGAVCFTCDGWCWMEVPLSEVAGRKRFRGRKWRRDIKKVFVEDTIKPANTKWMSYRAFREYRHTRIRKTTQNQ